MDVPASMTGGAVDPPPELTSMAILRGEIAPGCPAVVIAGTRPRAGRSLRAEARRFGAAFAADTGEAGDAGDAAECRRWRVEGARDARRIDGLIKMEEGLSDDAVERATLVVAAMRGQFVTLTVRTRPADATSPARWKRSCARSACSVAREGERMTSEAGREMLRKTFDRAAGLYQRARPDYPEALFDHLVRVVGLRAGDHLLEVGCATGKATLPLARRGFRIICVEPGSRLAEGAREHLAAFPGVWVVQARFEEWPLPQEPPERRFALVFAATAWQWLDPGVRYRRAWEALRPGGHLAFWDASHVFPKGGDPFFREIQEVYEEIGEGLSPGAPWPRPGELTERRDEIEAGRLFEVMDVRHFDWEQVYDAEGYIDLLNTFSGHIAMREWQRARLFGEIRRRLAVRPEATLRRHWGAVLHIARRRG